jgi:2-(1,2-epoxy-1,2-dihydrophenyl)acetyl-CoA isomerase
MVINGRFRGFEVSTDHDGVAVVTMNEPDRLNGTTQPMKRDMTEAFTQCQMDDDVRVVVITGTGRAFCAGDDLSGRPRDWQNADALMPTLPPGHQDAMSTYEALRTMSQALNLTLRDMDKLTIAAINGIAIQTGLSLALACDFRIASTEARLGSATLRYGLLPDEGGHALIVQLIGLAKSLDFFMRKRIVTAAEALQLGLIHEVTSPETLMDRAMELAREFAAGPQVAMRLLKRSLYKAAEMPLASACDDIAMRTAISDHHPDGQEGIAAFLQKRPPKFA